MKIVSVEQMLSIEKLADSAGLSYELMMHNAGSGVADWVNKNLITGGSVVGLVGSGNNGGDTLIALKILSDMGVRTLAFLMKQREEDPLVDAYLESGGQLVDFSQNDALKIFSASLQPNAILLDGILGTGLRLPLRGSLKQRMTEIRNTVKNRPDVVTVAVDCPSGMDCDTGEVSEAVLPATHTLCMAAIKQGLLKFPGRSIAGKLHLINIGINDIDAYLSSSVPIMIHHDLARDCLPSRPNSGHKGTFGTCLVVAGSMSFIGAAYLTGKASYFSGCGLVNVATIEKVYSNLAGQLIEAVWTILPDINGAYDRYGTSILKGHINKVDSMIVGPGWGLQEETLAFLKALLKDIPKNLPIIIDADGLKLLRQIDTWWKKLPYHAILTPHPGEMSILTGLEIGEIQSHRWEIAQEYAKKWGVVLILKGAVSVIATPTGQIYLNPISDSALATAGSGDVLSGIIGGLLAQGVSTRKACILATWLHGQAGIIARQRVGSNYSVTALEILAMVPTAFKQLIKGA